MADCFGKQAFSDPQLARAVLRRSKQTARSGKRKGKGGTAREVYRCVYCHQWHLGRSNKDIQG